MSELQPADLFLAYAAAITVSEGRLVSLMEACWCTECGGTQRVVRSDEPEGPGHDAPCLRCRDTDGWDPDRVQRLCTKHRAYDSGARSSGEPLCEVFHLGLMLRPTWEMFSCEWGWVPRIGTLP